MYKYRRGGAHGTFDFPQPSSSTNLFDQLSQPTFSTSVLNQQYAFHPRHRRRPFGLDNDERDPRVLRIWLVRHQHLREELLPLQRYGSYLPSRDYMREHLCVRCLRSSVSFSIESELCEYCIANSL